MISVKELTELQNSSFRAGKPLTLIVAGGKEYVFSEIIDSYIALHEECKRIRYFRNKCNSERRRLRKMLGRVRRRIQHPSVDVSNVVQEIDVTLLNFDPFKYEQYFPEAKD